MFGVKLTRDEETGKPIPLCRAWIGDTTDGYQVINTSRPHDPYPGIWHKDTATEIAAMMNRKLNLEGSVTDDASNTNQ